MSRQTFPTWFDQPGCTMRNFRITGASVGSTPGSAGLDGRGQNLCKISQAANVFTVTYLAAFGDIPYIFFQPSAGQSNTIVNLLTNTAQGFTFECFEADSHTTAVVNPNLDVRIDSYNTTSFVS
jgi:hypothetical protein